jgi:hypothetical protein
MPQPSVRTSRSRVHKYSANRLIRQSLKIPQLQRFGLGYVRDTCKKVSQGREPRLGADTLDDLAHHGTADAAS